MIQIKLREKTRVSIDFTFFAVIALFFYFDENGLAFMSVCACIIHETGHLAALFLEKRELKSLTFYGGGIKINYDKSLDASVRLIIAGSLLNFTVFIIFYFIFHANLMLKVFALINLIIGIFNLFPVRFFDGGRLLEKILIKLFHAGKALSILRKTEIVTTLFTIIMPIFIIASGNINPTLLIVMLYIIISDIIYKKEC
ncbi:MAG: site-2 protease family protein [Oscillospiraceae bacterium]|nr:site-2 protease family protein [Oscillospiraceae bacterium]